MKQTTHITGKVHAVSKEQVFSEKFRKQAIVLDLMWDEQKSWTNYRQVEFINDMINQVPKEGDVVRVEVELTGNYYEKKDMYFNSDRVLHVEVLKKSQDMADNLSTPYQKAAEQEEYSDDLPF